MIISVLVEAVKKKDLPVDEFFEFLSSICQELFMPLYDKHRNYAKEIALYILYAYSKDSDMVLLHANWDTNKRQIADKVMLPDAVINDVLFLKCQYVRKVITDYLDYQKEWDFKFLKLNQDLEQQLAVSIYQDMYPEVKDDQTIKLDFDEISKKRRVLLELRAEISAQKAKLNDEYDFVNENMVEIQKEEKKVVSLDIEHNDYVK